MRNQQNWWLAAIIIVIGVWCCVAQGDVVIEPPLHKITAGHPALFRIDRQADGEVPQITIAVSPAETCRVAIVRGLFDGRYIWFEANANGPHVLAVASIGSDGKLELILIAVNVGGGKPVPPLPPSDNITAETVRGWLATVSVDVRTEVITDPVTGDKYTRQEAVGRTFSEIGKTVKSLGSIKAANVMLTTGLAAAFGTIDPWKSFANSVDEALAKAEQKKISPAEYGKILSIIGGALL